MSLFDDDGAEMHRLPFDSTTADAFLAGRVDPDDAPPGFQELATLIRAARPPAASGAEPLEQVVVAAFAAAVRPPGVSTIRHQRGGRRMLGKLLSMKMAAAAATVALGGTAAAAATGSLPGPAQSAVSGALSHVGISVPSPNGHASPHASAGAANAAGHGRSAPASGADAYGLCTAWAAASAGTATNANATRAQDTFSQLTAAAAAKGESVQQFCASVTPPSTVPATPSPSPAPTGTTGGAPAGTPSGAPSGTTSGAPAGTQSGAPSGTPSGAPAGTPSGAPAGTPSGGPSGVTTTAPASHPSGR